MGRRIRVRGRPWPVGFALHAPEAQLLQGRRALVTGGNSGIGQGTCYELAAHGAAVAINYVGQPGAADDMVKEITTAGGRAISVPMDVSSEDDVAKGFAQAREALG